MSNEEYQQHELRECLHGSAGGRTTVEKHGNEHMQEIGRSGGQAYVEKYGMEHMHQKAANARAAKIKKRYTEPRTVERTWSSAGVVERLRIVPFRPKGSKRRTPDFVITEHEIKETNE